MNKATPIAQLPRHSGGAPPRSGEIPEIVDDDDVAIQEVLAEINQVQDASVTNVQMQQPYTPPSVTIQPPKVPVQPPPMPPQPGTPYPQYPMPPQHQQPYPQHPHPPPYFMPHMSPMGHPHGSHGPHAPPGLMDSVAKHLWHVCKWDMILFGIIFIATFIVSTEQVESVLRVYLANTRFPYATVVVKALLAGIIVIMVKRFIDSS